jgi:hypothetical protein
MTTVKYAINFVPPISDSEYRALTSALDHLYTRRTYRTADTMDDGYPPNYYDDTIQGILDTCEEYQFNAPIKLLALLDDMAYHHENLAMLHYERNDGRLCDSDFHRLQIKYQKSIADTAAEIEAVQAKYR